MEVSCKANRLGIDQAPSFQKLVAMLVAAGVDTHAVSENGYTAFDSAYLNNDSDIVRILVESDSVNEIGEDVVEYKNLSSLSSYWKVTCPLKDCAEGPTMQYLIRIRAEFELTAIRCRDESYRASMSESI